jgi:hypothetical protein
MRNLALATISMAVIAIGLSSTLASASAYEAHAPSNYDTAWRQTWGRPAGAGSPTGLAPERPHALPNPGYEAHASSNYDSDYERAWRQTWDRPAGAGGPTGLAPEQSHAWCGCF